MLTVKAVVFGSYMQKLLSTRTVVCSVRQNSDVSFLRDANPGHFRTGKGGRSSFSGKVVTVFGASVFLGKHIISHLAKIGTQVVIPYREMYFAKKLKTVGDLGQLVFTEYELNDEESLRRAMLYSDTVINLVSKNYNDVPHMVEKTNVVFARRCARIAREMGVKNFIQISALNCDVKQKGFWNENGSEFLDSKYRSELAVKEEFPNATIFRPSDIFGHGDAFFRSLLSPFRITFGRLSVPHGGVGIYKQPVYVLNVAEAITNAVMNPTISEGKTYEAIGPRRYEYHDLLDYLHRVTRRDHLVIGDSKYNYWLKLKLMFNQSLPIQLYPKDLYNLDRMEREAISDTTSGLPTLVDLNVTLVPLETTAEFTFKIFRRHRNTTNYVKTTFLEPHAKYEEILQ